MLSHNSQIIKGPWQPTLIVILVQEAVSTWGRTEFSGGSQMRPESECKVFVGVKSGISPALLAHEGHHAATWLLRDPNWRQWSPKWSNIRFHQEETKSWIIEQVVNHGISLAWSQDCLTVNPYRDINKGPSV